MQATAAVLHSWGKEPARKWELIWARMCSLFSSERALIISCVTPSGPGDLPEARAEMASLSSSREKGVLGRSAGGKSGEVGSGWGGEGGVLQGCWAR